MNPPALFPISSRSRGFTLTEIALVLSIAGLILGAIWVAAGAAWMNHKVYETTQQMQTVVSDARDYYARAASFPAAATYTHALGGPLVVSFPAAAVPVVLLQVQGLTTEACVKLFFAVPVNDKGNGVFAVSAIGSATNALTPFPNADTPTTLATYCDKAGKANELDFTFRLRGTL